MRINQYIARAIGVSRRAADKLVEQGRVAVNGRRAKVGEAVSPQESVAVDGRAVNLSPVRTIIFHKPINYVSSRRQQGSSPTIYQLLPKELHQLKTVGRLDKDSSGLLLLTNDGRFGQEMSHPSSGKWKRYYVEVTPALKKESIKAIEAGVQLSDGLSQMQISQHRKGWHVRLQEGRNRQIRRTFDALGYTVTKLHRDQMGDYRLDGLAPGQWKDLEPK